MRDYNAEYEVIMNCNLNVNLGILQDKEITLPD